MRCVTVFSLARATVYDKHQHATAEQQQAISRAKTLRKGGLGLTTFTS